jgi:hypothetical protein
MAKVEFRHAIGHDMTLGFRAAGIDETLSWGRIAGRFPGMIPSPLRAPDGTDIVPSRRLFESRAAPSGSLPPSCP